MALPVPEPGLVIGYSYLWHREFEQNQEEGSKDRPCAIILTAENKAGDTVVTVLPITHSPPAEENDAVEIPVAVKQRLGLDEAQSWILVTEVNRFVWPGPDLRRTKRGKSARFDFGPVPPSLYRRIRDRFMAAAATHRVRIVPRSR